MSVGTGGTHRRAGIIVLALVLILAPWIGTVAAQGDEEAAEPGQPSEQPQGDWTLELETRRAEVLWTMHRSDETTREWINGSFDGLADQLVYRYTKIIQDPEDLEAEPTVHKIDLTVALTAVYEYRDTNNNSRFELSDEIVAYQSIHDSGVPLVHQRDHPRQIQGARVVYPLEGGGELHLELFMSPTTDKQETRLVFPGDAELNLTVRNRPATEPGTRVGVQLRAWGGETFERAEDELTVKHGKAVGYVRWLDHSLVDDVRIPVGITTLEEIRSPDNTEARNEGLIIMSTPAGQEITHRISIGTYVEESRVEKILATVGDWSIYTVGLLGALIFVGVTVVSKLKGRGQAGGRGGGSVRDY